jgi:hypothetical protein
VKLILGVNVFIGIGSVMFQSLQLALVIDLYPELGGFVVWEIVLGWFQILVGAAVLILALDYYKEEKLQPKRP